MEENLKLENQLCFPLYACSKEVIRSYQPHLKALKLTYTQYITMLFLWQKEKPVTVKDLGEALMLDSGTLTPLLKKLEDKGYLERKQNRRDKRNLSIKLTYKGQKLKEKAAHIPNEIGNCLGLTPDEGFTLYRLTYKIISNLRKD